MIGVPEDLSWWRGVPGGAAWLQRLPRLAAELADEWALTLGAPFAGRVSLVLAARRADGEQAVLKLNFPEPESAEEADALAVWDGEGAARLLECDRERRALLVERLEPGTQLWAVADEDASNRIAASLLRRIAVPLLGEHPFRVLAVEAERWSAELPRRWERLGARAPRAILDEALGGLRELLADAPAPVLLHQDLHGGNVLRSGDGWRAIDPKPLAGDPAFDTASLLRDRRDELARNPAGAAPRMRRRLDLLADELGYDRERMRLWGLVHALAWGLEEDGTAHHGHLTCAELLVRAR